MYIYKSMSLSLYTYIMNVYTAKSCRARSSVYILPKDSHVHVDNYYNCHDDRSDGWACLAFSSSLYDLILWHDTLFNIQWRGFQYIVKNKKIPIEILLFFLFLFFFCCVLYASNLNLHLPQIHSSILIYCPVL